MVPICGASHLRPVFAAPGPEHAASQVIKAFAEATFAGNSLDKIPTAVLARFLFVLGEVSLKHLVHIERLARAVDRRAPNATETPPRPRRRRRR